MTNKIIKEFRKERTDAISEMFDNKYANGIYPTSKFFARLDKALKKALASQRKQLLQEIEKEIPEWMKTSVAHNEQTQASVECFLEHLQREL